MSYQIGQIRKNNTGTYLTELTFRQVSGGITTEGYANAKFQDYAIELTNNQKFNANNTYYLRFTLKRIDLAEDPRFKELSPWSGNDGNDPRQLNIKLELFKNKNSSGVYQLGTYQVIQNLVRIDPYIAGVNSPQASFETIFTPNDTYTYLGFILSRVQYDYLGDRQINTNAKPRDDINSQTIDLSNNGDLCTISNILPLDRESVDKIGIQSRPGSLVCINREAMRIGRSGTIEVNNGVPINFVGIVGPNGSDAHNIDKFIFDYAWNG